MAELRYHAGEFVQLGDTVAWGAEATGTVVVMIEENIAIDGYDAESWKYLRVGFMLFVEDAGLIYYESCQNDSNMCLIKRSQCMHDSC